jgi:alpha-1,2-mannosyltransferase
LPKPAVRNLIWCGVIAAVIAATALPAAHRVWRGHTGDFTHFWQAAHAMLHVDDIYAAAAGRYVYPPLLAFLFQPLALIPERAAAIVWIAINSGLILATVLLAAKEVSARWRIENALLIAALALALNIDKIRSLLSLGQSDGLMLLAFACVLAWMEGKPLLAGLAVGLSANIKYVSLIFVPYFLIKRNYRAVAAAMLSFGFFMLLPAVEVGFTRGAEYARTALQFFSGA